MKKIKQILILSLMVVAFTTACSNKKDEVDNGTSTPTEVPVENADALYKAGTYTAEADGMNGPVKEHNETPG